MWVNILQFLISLILLFQSIASIIIFLHSLYFVYYFSFLLNRIPHLCVFLFKESIKQTSPLKEKKHVNYIAPLSEVKFDSHLKSNAYFWEYIYQILALITNISKRDFLMLIIRKIQETKRNDNQ